MGVDHDVFITIPKNSYTQLKPSLHLQPKLTAPIIKGQQYGTIDIALNNKNLYQIPVVALANDSKGGWWTSTTDHIAMTFHSWFN